MRITVVSKNKTPPQMTKLLKKNGFTLVKKNPDFVISFGGDGTILYSERLYPEIPKLVIKTSRKCRKCDYTPKHLHTLLNKIKTNQYKIIEIVKVEAKFKNKKLIALNEIQVRHKNPTVAIRFSVSINEKKIENLIGDGVIVASTFGSTGYYKSAGGKQFTKGFGVVFNNMCTEGKKNFIASNNPKIKIKINREDGLLIRDNDSKFYTVKPDEEITIYEAKRKAKFLLF